MHAVLGGTTRRSVVKGAPRGIIMVFRWQQERGSLVRLLRNLCSTLAKAKRVHCPPRIIKRKNTPLACCRLYLAGPLDLL